MRNKPPAWPVRPALLQSVLWCLMAFLMAGVGGLLAIKLEGGQVLSVQTGSMEPVLRPGDAVIVRAAGTRSLRTGDIVSYQSPRASQVVITHRLVSVSPVNGWLITKGDALAAPDPAFPPRRLVGRVIAVSPKLGIVLDDLRRPAGLLLGVYVPAATLLGGEIRRLANARARWQYRLRTA